MTVTLKHIAKYAGVDISVVSRVLNDKGDEFRISEKRQLAIRNAAKSLGYSPNLSAQAIRTGRFGCVSLLLSSYLDRSYLPSMLLDGIHDELEKHDMHVLLTRLPDKTPGDYSRVPKVFRLLMADGMIVNYSRYLPPEIESLVKKSTLPTIWISVKQKNNSVYSDSFSAARKATEKLIKLGHRRIAYYHDFVHPDISDSQVHYSGKDRFLGYQQAMADAGLETRETRTDDINHLAKMLSQPNRPTAFVLYWSHCVPILLWAMRTMGLVMPKDVSVITFSSESLIEQLCVSAMIEPDNKMGCEASDMMLKKLQKKKVTDIVSRVVDFSFLDMGTCLPPVNADG